MKIKKSLLVSAFVFIFIINLYLISAELNVLTSFEPIRGTIINTNEIPAVFDITITNHEAGGTFEIYTYEKFKITPSEFNLSAGQSQKIRFEFLPFDSMIKNKGHVPVPLYIKQKGGSQTYQTKIIIKLVDFSEAFDVGSENINPDSNSAQIYFYNIEDVSYDNIKATFSSNFFDDKTETFSLKPYEKKLLNIPINKEKISKLVYGTYAVSANVNLNDKIDIVKGSVKIIEKSGISYNEQKSGLIIRTFIVEKTNEGNIPSVADVSMRKSIISRLFTTFSLEPNKVERKGFWVDYFWQKELAPAEKLSVKATTNWIFPLFLLIAIIIIGWLSHLYFSSHLIIKKRASFVRTKTNDFALKVSIHVKAKKFMEKISIYERLPAMTKMFEKYGESPTSYDHERGKLRWDIERLDVGEERVFTYVMHSKLKIVGRFELPVTIANYEMNGKVHQAKSNKVFFINEPERQRREEN